MKRRMFVMSFCMFIFFISLTTAVNASTESQALVAEGRALLFNSGNPTYSGLLSANAKFEAAVAADSTDQEANLFYAVTRLLASGLEQGTGLETVRDLLEAFGINRNDVDSVEAGIPFNDPPEIYGEYDPPDTIPGGEDVRTFLADSFMTLLDAAIGNLNVVTNTNFNITLPASETGEGNNIEVDYSDVLMFQSVLYTLKSAILIMTAYDLDIDLRELLVLDNADVLQIQRDLLDKYPNVLELRSSDGAASLTEAKSALLNAIDACEAAFNFITTESDPQGDDLFYFDSAEDVNKATNFIFTQLAELKDSLSENRPAVFTIIEEEWELYDANTSASVGVEFERDNKNGKLVWGEFWYDRRGNGWVDSFLINGSTVTVKFVYDEGWPLGRIDLTGEINAGGSSITNGIYTTFDKAGNSVFSGSYSGERTYYDTDREEWRFTDESNCTCFNAGFNKDSDGNLTSGWFWDNCHIDLCMTDISVSSSGTTTTITAGLDSENASIGKVVLTGEISGDGESISNGSYEIYDNQDNIIFSGNCPGERELETETIKIDFNRIFGNSDKDPLNIRAIMPEFDQYDESVPGTFPGDPVLNGILPDLTTNDDLTRELELETPPIPITGDWNGDGRDNLGLYYPGRRQFSLDTNNDGILDQNVSMGRTGDLPVIGDWDGNGIDDIGVFRPSGRRFYLDTDRDGIHNISVTIGRAGDVPVVGDWDQDGRDDIGVFRPSVRRYYMDFDEDGIHDRAVTIGRIGDYSLVGDWDGDGADSIGVYRPGNHRFYLDDDDDGIHDHAATLGTEGDIPVTGDWDGDGQTDVGVFRPSDNTFYLDSNLDGTADETVRMTTP